MLAEKFAITIITIVIGTVFGTAVFVFMKKWLRVVEESINNSLQQMKNNCVQRQKNCQEKRNLARDAKIGELRRKMEYVEGRLKMGDKEIDNFKQRFERVAVDIQEIKTVLQSFESMHEVTKTLQQLQFQLALLIKNNKH